VAAVDHLDEILLDHAHCEKKAAATAVKLIFLHQDRAEWMAPLSALAREELEHFEQVLAILQERGIAFERLSPSPYARRLHKHIRDKEPGRLIDGLLVASLIEARSCERMKLLAAALGDQPLGDFYRELLACEARHHTIYVDMAASVCGRDEAEARLAELAVQEAQVVARGPKLARLHAPFG
jgi:tRNA-(ms[2]io[6]A)-hydroxylase